MPLVWLSLGFVLGVYASRLWEAPLGAVVLLLAALAGGALLWRSWGLRYALPWLLVAGLLLGLGRGGPHLLDPPGGLEKYHGSETEVRGLAVSYPEMFGQRVRVQVKVEEVRAPDGEWVSEQGAVLA